MNTDIILYNCYLYCGLQGQGERAYKVVWAPGEQRELEAALARHPESKHPPLERYLRIAACLPHKVHLLKPWTRLLCKQAQVFVENHG